MEKEWISVKERMPETLDKVNVYFGHVDNILMGRYYSDRWKVFFSDGEVWLGEESEVDHPLDAPSSPS